MLRDESEHPGALIGEQCNIASTAVIGPGTELGARVQVGHGAVIMGPCKIGDDCIIASGCILDGSSAEAAEMLVLEAGVVVLAGSVIAACITIAAGSRVLPGAVVQRSVPAHAIVSGNPAQIEGYTLSSGILPKRLEQVSSVAEAKVEATQVRGVTIHRFPRILDLRGNLTVGEFGRTVPFNPKRYFMVFDVPSAEIRGEHAHRVCEQFLICARGSCSVVADDGESREEFVLSDPSLGLYLPALTWGVQYKYSADAVLLVFASHYYSSAEYIRNYDEFLALATSRAPGSQVLGSDA